jgi:hypothetical protein
MLVNAVSLSGVATFGTQAIGPAVVIPMIDTLGAEGIFLWPLPLLDVDLGRCCDRRGP